MIVIHEDAAEARPTFANMLSRLVLMAAIVIGVSHVVTFSSSINHAVVLGWKVMSVGTLAIYAMLKARNLDGWLIASVMLFSALSDIFLVTLGQIPGALSFIVADCLAIWLYVRHRRPQIKNRDYVLAVALLVAATGLAFALPADRGEAIGIAIFTLPLAVMAACAALSRFPRHLVGLGAGLVLSSDLLIFARMGPLAEMLGGAELVWLSYFVGEVLVVMGVTRSLQRSRVFASPSIKNRE